MMNFREKGMSLILPVLLLGVTGISVFLLLAASIVGALADLKNHTDSSVARGYLFGCLDEYLVHLPSEPDFSPTTLTYLDATCSTTVTTTVEGFKQITLTAVNGSVTRHMTARVQLDPLAIVKITEP